MNKQTQKSYFIAIPAYNEEKTIRPCLEAINEAKNWCKDKFRLLKTIVCLNGCTDNTFSVVDQVKTELPSLNINILESQKRGMNYALNTIFANIDLIGCPVVKIDADAIVERDSLEIILREFQKHPELKVVGGHPIARKYKEKNIYKKLLSNILDIRSRFPESQVAVKNVAEFHELAKKDPQLVLTPGFEEKSRIYFHGRFYALKDKTIWSVPGNRIGDDTYLTLDVYKKYGKDSMRIRYDANCYYHPSTSLKRHWKVYKRIFLDTYSLFRLPEFSELGDVIGKEAVRLDWIYINKKPLKIRLYFVLYWIIKKLESLLFRLSSKQYNRELWSYDSKPEL